MGSANIEMDIRSVSWPVCRVGMCCTQFVTSLGWVGGWMLQVMPPSEVQRSVAR